MQDEERQKWLQSRCGCVGASRIADVLARPMKGAKEATTRRNYKAELVCELLTNKVQEQFMSWDMKRGIELEPDARTEYEVRRGVIVLTSGFVMHPAIARSGATPDGLVGEDGLTQFKAPKTANHLDWLTAGKVPTEYKPQMLWEMACTERQWTDFVSYDPNLPDHLQLFIVRFNRDDAEIARIEAEVIAFNEEIDAIIRQLPSAQQPAPPLRESVKETIRAARRNPEAELTISNADLPK